MSHVTDAVSSQSNAGAGAPPTRPDTSGLAPEVRRARRRKTLGSFSANGTAVVLTPKAITVVYGGRRNMLSKRSAREPRR